MVGDSGEKDIESYASIAEEFPDRILKIFIRDVTSDKPFSTRMAHHVTDMDADPAAFIPTKEQVEAGIVSATQGVVTTEVRCQIAYKNLGREKWKLFKTVDDILMDPVLLDYVRGLEQEIELGGSS